MGLKSLSQLQSQSQSEMYRSSFIDKHGVTFTLKFEKYSRLDDT